MPSNNFNVTAVNRSLELLNSKYKKREEKEIEEIERQKSKVIVVYERRINEISKDIDKRETELKQISKDIDKRETELKKIIENRDELLAELKNFKEILLKVSRSLRSRLEYLDRKISETKRNILLEKNKAISQYNKPTELLKALKSSTQKKLTQQILGSRLSSFNSKSSVLSNTSSQSILTERNLENIIKNQSSTRKNQSSINRIANTPPSRSGINPTLLMAEKRTNQQSARPKSARPKSARPKSARPKSARLNSANQSA